MKKFILSILFVSILIFVTGCNVTKVDFEGNNEMETLEFTELSNDKVYTLEIVNISLKNEAININYVEGDTSQVKITTDKNILDTLNITNRNGVIKISGEAKYRYEITDFNIEISNVKLSKFDLEGAFSVSDEVGNYSSSLDIYIKGVISGDLNLENVVDNLKVTIDGVTDTNLSNVNLKNAEFKINGTADVKAIGNVDKLKVDADGLFDLNFKDLVAKVADVKVDGTSFSSINVTDELILDVNGLSNVDYYGNPATTNITKDGLVTITKK